MKALTQTLEQKIKHFFFLFTLLNFVTNSNAQTITFNLTTPPCNHDGVLIYTVSGVTPPMTVQISGASGSYTSFTTTDLTDTIVGYSGELIYIYAYNGLAFAYNSISAEPFTYTTSTTPAICPVLGSGTAIVTGGLPPYTIEWLDTDLSTVIGTGSPAALPGGGEYGIKITDANGCVFGTVENNAMDSILVPYISGISFSLATTTANCTNGTVNVTGLTGGTPPLTYLWSNGATTPAITGLISGVYSLTITDANGCNTSSTAWVPQAYPIIINTVPSAATCLLSNGSVISFPTGGVAPYTYAYSTGATTQTATGLTAGPYSLTVLDANGCHAAQNFTIPSVSPIIASYTSTPSSCTTATGTSTLTMSGGTPPYTTTWYVTPVQTGPVLNAMLPGTYSFSIVDAVGCTKTGNVTINANTPLTSFAMGANTTCPLSNGTASMYISSGTPPYSYLWSTGATTNTISGLAAGSYSCQVTDGDGCTLVKDRIVNTNSPFSIGLTTTQASCKFTSDGTITSVVTGGTPPYTYSWSGTGASTSSVTGLSSGYYWLTVTDALGCSHSVNTFVPYNTSATSCFCTVNGIVYNDINNNCILDPGENGIKNIPISLSGFGTMYTNALGAYSVIVPSGSYTLTEIVKPYYPLSTCQPASFPIVATASSGCVITNNFANTIDTIQDLYVLNTYYTPPVPGNNFNPITVVTNNGTLTESTIQFGYKHDGALTFLGSGSVSYIQLDAIGNPNWWSVVSGFPTLATSHSHTITNNYFVPTTTPIGTGLYMFDTVCVQAPISDWVNDQTPWNNIGSSFPVVVSSYDPNFKEVHPKGVGPQGLIKRSENVLEYIVHFQNTGTYYAQNVIVRDTLNANLNWSTLAPGWSDHNYTAFLDENGVATFTFENIYLPDSTSDPLGSMGMFAFTIEINSGLPDLTQITNNASIYFDYNAPIITNTTINTIADSLTTNIKNIEEKNSFDLYPNPATSQVTIVVNTNDLNKSIQLNVMDINGKLIYSSNENTNKQKQVLLNTTTWQRGVYLVNVQTENSNTTKKLIIY